MLVMILLTFIMVYIVIYEKVENCNEMMLLFTASIHLVHLMLDEYAFLVIETQQEMEVEKILQRAVQRHMKNAGMIA